MNLFVVINPYFWTRFGLIAVSNIVKGQMITLIKSKSVAIMGMSVLVGGRDNEDE